MNTRELLKEIEDVFDKVDSLEREIKIYKDNFTDISQASHSNPPVIPLTYDMLQEGKYIWQNSAKTYRRINKVFQLENGQKRVQIDGCYYSEDKILGHFFKYDFNW